MALTNTQYDEILRGYDARQLHNKDVLESRTKELHKRAPELLEIDHSIAQLSVDSARRLFDGDKDAIDNLKKQIAELKKRNAAFAEMTVNELKVYQLCSEHGILNISSVAKQSGLSRPTIYRILHNLSEKYDICFTLNDLKKKKIIKYFILRFFRSHQDQHQQVFQ